MEPENYSTGSSVLIVDDSSIVCLVFERALNKAGYHVRTAKDGEKAIALLKKQPAHALLLDLKMPQMTGLELMRTVRELWPKTEIEALLEKPVVFYKGYKLEIISTIKKLERENVTSSPAENSYHEALAGPNQSEEKNHAR